MHDQWKTHTHSTKSSTRLQVQTAKWLMREDHNVMVTPAFTGDEGVGYQHEEKAFGRFAHGLKSYFVRK